MTSNRVNADELDPTGRNWFDWIVKHIERNPALLPSGVLWNLLINCSSAEVLREICFNEQMRVFSYSVHQLVIWKGLLVRCLVTWNAYSCLYHIILVGQTLYLYMAQKNYPTCHSFKMSEVPMNAAIALLAWNQVPELITQKELYGLFPPRQSHSFRYCDTHCFLSHFLQQMFIKQLVCVRHWPGD